MGAWVIVDIRLQKQIELVDKYISYLKEEQQVSKEEFLSDRKLQASVERWLQMTIESCINIGSILISMKKLHRGENFADIFIELNRENIISDDLTRKLIAMTKFRNRLVYVYWELEGEFIYDILKKNLDDITNFIEEVLEIVGA